MLWPISGWSLGCFIIIIVFSLFYVIYIATTGVTHVPAHCCLYALIVTTVINVVFCCGKLTIYCHFQSHLLSLLKSVLFLRCVTVEITYQVGRFSTSLC